MGKDKRLPQGYLVAGRYTVIKPLATGGMGTVYEAYDSRLRRAVAIKFLDPNLVTDEESVTRFQQEAIAASRIGHEGICDVRDRGTCEKGLPYIVMELLEGTTLEALIRREGLLQARRALPIIISALKALGAAHRANIVHRDLKPENIFLHRTVDDEERVKLLDFGISRFLDDANQLQLTKSGMAIGTPWYMSPEQAMGLVNIDHRSDIWSIGVVLYEALSGQLPFKAQNYTQLQLAIVNTEPIGLQILYPAVDSELDRIVMKTLSKDRDERYSDTKELAGELKEVLASN